jgi:2-oxoglutarate ferredoxin oxidoreductase subunit alpha
MFNLTIQSVNLAEKYRVPVILLSDEVVAHLREKVALPAPETIEIFERVKPTVPPDWYKPFEDVESGIPPMADFGEGYRYHVTGLTHDVLGFPTTVPGEVKTAIERLHRKISHGMSEIVMIEEFMLEDAEVAIVAYGCVARSAKSAALELRKRGVKTGVLRLITLWPFPDIAIEGIVKKIKKIVVPEMNMGQIYHEVVRASAGKARVKSCNRVDGDMLTPAEIVETFIRDFKR